MRDVVQAGTQIIIGVSHYEGAAKGISVTALAVNADSYARELGLFEIIDLGGPRDTAVSFASHSHTYEDEPDAENEQKTEVEPAVEGYDEVYGIFNDPFSRD